MIYCVLNPDICHQQLVLLPISPVYCSQFTLENPKNFQQYYWYIPQIIYIISEENKLLPPYSPHLKNVSALPCKMHNFFIWLKAQICCIPPNVSGSEKSRSWVGIGGSEKNWLWCVTNGISGKQCHSKRWKWPPSAWIHDSSLFRHWSTASSTTLC